MKEFKVTIPEGYEIDKENSTFECIKFRPKQLCYSDVAEQLFDGKISFYLNERGDVSCDMLDINTFADANNCITQQQAEKLAAFNKLLNVAYYLSNGWKFSRHDYTTPVYYLIYTKDRIEIYTSLYILGFPAFKSEGDAQKAIEILGEEIIKIALS